MICKKIESCKEKSSRQKFSYSDPKGGGSKYFIKNANKTIFYKLEYEHCVFEKEEHPKKKCDLGIVTATNSYYIELKGSHVNDGIKQLLSTIKATENCFKGLNKKARLIVSRVPDIKSTRNTKEYIALIKLINGPNHFVLKQNVYTENI